VNANDLQFGDLFAQRPPFQVPKYQRSYVDAWIDGHRLGGGSSWTKEIETALADADFVLALLTPGSYVS
jgi:hypothetical protein